MTAHIHMSRRARNLLAFGIGFHLAHAACLRSHCYRRAFHSHLVAFSKQEVARDFQRLRVDLHQHVIHHAG